MRQPLVGMDKRARTNETKKYPHYQNSDIHPRDDENREDEVSTARAHREYNKSSFPAEDVVHIAHSPKRGARFVLRDLKSDPTRLDPTWFGNKSQTFRGSHTETCVLPLPFFSQSLHKRRRIAWLSSETITFILERISHCIGRFVARQLIAEILQLLQLLPNVLHGILEVVVVAAGRTDRARCGLLAEALPLLHHHHVGVRLAGGGRVVGLKFCRALRAGNGAGRAGGGDGGDGGSGRDGGGGGGREFLKPRGRRPLTTTPRVGVRFVLLLLLLLLGSRLLARALAILLRFRVCYRARTRVPQRSTAGARFKAYSQTLGRIA